MTNAATALVPLSIALVWLEAAAQTAPPTAASSAALAAAPAGTLSATEQTLRAIQQPVSWFAWGGDMRVRSEYFNNAQSLDADAALNEQWYLRFRGRVWGSLTPVERLSLNVRLAAEPREWLKPSSAASYRGQSGFEGNYGIFDNFNVQWREVLGLPAYLTVGRQDITLGDGWLVLDGTPRDGSWTYFLDAARLTCELKEQHTVIDAIGIVQSAHDDAWLPTINNQNRLVTDQNEKGAILEIVNKAWPAANVGGYFMYKHDTRVSDPAGRFGDNGDLFLLGGRVGGLWKQHWKYSVEGAYEFGEKQDPSLTQAIGSPSEFRDLAAFGVNARLAYVFEDKLRNQVSFSYEYLSGDDPQTSADEMMDLLWGRWPRWSELYNVYSYVPETRVAQTANLHRLGPGWMVSPGKDLEFSANYYLLFADQEVPTRASSPALFTGDGNFRGHYLQAILKYKFSPRCSGHLWSEFVFPGDFYANRDLMTFLRAEVMLTF